MARSELALGDILGPLFGFGSLAKKAAETARTVNPLFDPAYYANNNPHVVKGGIDLHDHYAYFGCRNGYDPNPYFQSAWYIAQYEDVRATGANPLDHYLDRGAIEGRNPSPAFGTWLYLLLYPDVRASGLNPLLHFLRHGQAEGRLAPPVCLVPSLGVMQHGAIDHIDLGSHNEAETLARQLHGWSERLLGRVAATSLDTSEDAQSATSKPPPP